MAKTFAILSATFGIYLFAAAATLRPAPRVIGRIERIQTFCQVRHSCDTRAAVNMNIGVSQVEVLASMQRFAEEVMPHFAVAGAAREARTSAMPFGA
jgi:hypothetical protein